MVERSPGYASLRYSGILAQRTAFARNQFIFTKCLPFDANTVIPAALHHSAGIPGNDHAWATLFRGDFLTDRKDHTRLLYQEKPLHLR